MLYACEAKSLMYVRACTFNIHAYVHTHTHTHIHIYVHTYVQKYIHTYMLTYSYKQACKLTQIHTHTHIYIYIHTHIYVHTYQHNSRYRQYVCIQQWARGGKLANIISLFAYTNISQCSIIRIKYVCWNIRI
jgi:hypothetical protein